MFARTTAIVVCAAFAAPVLAQQPLAVRFPEKAEPRAMALSPDGKRLAYLDPTLNRPTVVVCDTATGAVDARFQTNTAGLGGSTLGFSPDGKTLLVGVALIRGPGGHALEVWDPVKGACLHTVKTEPKQGHRGFFLSDNKSVVVADATAAYAVYDVTTGNLVARPPSKHAGCVRLASSADDKLILSGHEGGHAVLWDAVKHAPLVTVQASEGQAIACVAISPKKDRFATFTQDGMLCLWDARTGERIDKIFARQYGLTVANSLAFRDGGKTVLAVGPGHEPGILLWDPAAGTVSGPQMRRGKDRRRASIRASAISGDGATLVTSDLDLERISSWDLRAVVKQLKPSERDR